MYFGEDNGTRYNSGEFFGVIYQFSQSLNVCLFFNFEISFLVKLIFE